MWSSIQTTDKPSESTNQQTHRPSSEPAVFPFGVTGIPAATQPIRGEGRNHPRRFASPSQPSMEKQHSLSWGSILSLQWTHEVGLGKQLHSHKNTQNSNTTAHWNTAAGLSGFISVSALRARRKRREFNNDWILSAPHLSAYQSTVWISQWQSLLQVQWSKSRAKRWW